MIKEMLMKILVCYKYIRDEEGLCVNPDRTINADKSAWVISPYDLNAIEAGINLANIVGESTVEMLTVGGEVVDASKMRKAALSRGPAKMYAVKTEDVSRDNYSVASLLTQAIEKIGDVDLVLCGEGSGDMYSQQIGNILGQMLGWGVLNSVNELRYENGSLLANRAGDNRVETFTVKCKAVISVTSDICRPHIASMKDILGAGKKPVEVWAASDFENMMEKVKTESILAPEQTERKQFVYHEAEETELDEFCKAIKRSI
ncbi:MAG: electron transfer flavoprotein [Bacteroidia bacterium]|nr:electron transfer flavoprotein [Bacteroidia bacterium]